MRVISEKTYNELFEQAKKELARNEARANDFGQGMLEVLMMLYESNWHTGKPTEEGWYLVAFNYEDEEGVRYTTDYFKDGKWAFPMVRDISKLRAWQKIEPYKEASE